MAELPDYKAVIDISARRQSILDQLRGQNSAIVANLTAFFATHPPRPPTPQCTVDSGTPQKLVIPSSIQDEIPDAESLSVAAEVEGFDRITLEYEDEIGWKTARNQELESLWQDFSITEPEESGCCPQHLVKPSGEPEAAIAIIAHYPTFRTLAPDFGYVADRSNPCMSLPIKKGLLPGFDVFYLDRWVRRINPAVLRKDNLWASPSTQLSETQSALHTSYFYELLELSSAHVFMIMGHLNKAELKGHFSDAIKVRLAGLPEFAIVFDGEAISRVLVFVPHPEAVYHMTKAESVLYDRAYEFVIALAGISFIVNENYFQWLNSTRVSGDFPNFLWGPLKSLIVIRKYEKDNGTMVPPESFPPCVTNLAKSMSVSLTSESSQALQLLRVLALKGVEARRLAGYPNLEKERSKGYPGLEKAREKLRLMGYPGGQKSRETQRPLGYPSLKRASEVNKLLAALKCNECRKLKHSYHCDVQEDPFDSCSRCRKLGLECSLDPSQSGSAIPVLVHNPPHSACEECKGRKKPKPRCDAYLKPKGEKCSPCATLGSTCTPNTHIPTPSAPKGSSCLRCRPNHNLKCDLHTKGPGEKCSNCEKSAADCVLPTPLARSPMGSKCDLCHDKRRSCDLRFKLAGEPCTQCKDRGEECVQRNKRKTLEEIGRKPKSKKKSHQPAALREPLGEVNRNTKIKKSKGKGSGFNPDADYIP